MQEALEVLAPRASTSTPCACAPSRSRQRGEFIAAHDQVFVVEQNRDAQMRSLLVNELEIDPARLVKVLHYDGTPITARFITGAAITRPRRGAAVAKGAVA
jgi:2-oxoglutarate ferredoxin oxidoreductase subunit alpha